MDQEEIEIKHVIVGMLDNMVLVLDALKSDRIISHITNSAFFQGGRNVVKVRNESEFKSRLLDFSRDVNVLVNLHQKIYNDPQWSSQEKLIKQCERLIRQMDDKEFEFSISSIRKPSMDLLSHAIKLTGRRVKSRGMVSENEIGVAYTTLREALATTAGNLRVELACVPLQEDAAAKTEAVFELLGIDRKSITAKKR